MSDITQDELEQLAYTIAGYANHPQVKVIIDRDLADPGELESHEWQAHGALGLLSWLNTYLNIWYMTNQAPDTDAMMVQQYRLNTKTPIMTREEWTANGGSAEDYDWC